MSVEYSVVVPCYNSSHSLIELEKRTKQMFNREGKTFEIILINDCSGKLETWSTIQELAHKFPHVIGVNLLRNFGQNSATLCGMANSSGKYIITLDDDLQHSPEDIPLLIEQQHHDLVVVRLRQRKDKLFNQITSKIKSYFDYIVLDKPKHIRLSSFRLIKREIVDYMLKIKTPAPFIPALMFYVTRDIVNVEVSHNIRKDGKSNYTLRKRIQLFSLIVINNSSVILRLISYLGLFSAIISILLIAYLMLAQYLKTDPPIGWTSNISAILFFGGMTLFAVGLIGEYLIRIMAVVENKPTYVVRDIVK